MPERVLHLSMFATVPANKLNFSTMFYLKSVSNRGTPSIFQRIDSRVYVFVYVDLKK